MNKDLFGRIETHFVDCHGNYFMPNTAPYGRWDWSKYRE